LPSQTVAISITIGIKTIVVVGIVVSPVASLPFLLLSQGF